MPPASVIKIEITLAKIGRSMKNRDNQGSLETELTVDQGLAGVCGVEGWSGAGFGGDVAGFSDG